MLLIQCLTSILGFLSFIPLLVSTLPIQSTFDSDANDKIFANRRMTPQEQQQSWFSASNLDDSLQDDDGADFYVDLNRFSQLLSAHIMAEHLDSAVNTLSKKLAVQIQNSIRLIVRPIDPTIQQRRQSWNYQNNDNNDDDVDVRLLIEQLEGAVGSYVEDQLPTLWYHHRSFAALDSVSLRSFMEQTILTHCPLVSTDDSKSNQQQQQQQLRYISYQCLQPFTNTFSTSVDDFVKEHMQSTLVDIIQDDLPQLLIMTDNHIRAILNHFNTFLLSAQSQLSTDLVSLQDYQHAATWSSSSNIDSLSAILDSISDGENKADALIHSMHQYAVLAKVSIPSA